MLQGDPELAVRETPKPRPRVRRRGPEDEGAMLRPPAVATSLLAILAVGYTLYFAQSLLAPCVLAFMLHFLLAPLVRRMCRLGLSPAVATASVLSVLCVLVGVGFWKLSGPALEWMEQIPEALGRADDRIARLKAPVEAISDAADGVEKLADVGAKETSLKVEQAEGNGEVLTNAGSLIGGALITFFLLFFLLSTSSSLLRGVIRAIPGREDKRRVVHIVRTIEGEVSRYLVTITLINTALGVAVGTWTYALGMPSPILWGVLAGTLNFIPYLGSVVGVSIVALVGLTHFEEITPILLAPLGYMVLSSLEGMLLTPSILGGRLHLRRVILFVWLVAWGWLWGVLGALLAVPLLVVAKILCDSVPALAPLGALLGRGGSSRAPTPVRPS